MGSSCGFRSKEAVGGAVRAYADAGVDELILDPTVSSLEQVDLAAEAALS